MQFSINNHLLSSKYNSLRSAHARRPAYTLRLYLLLHQSLETQHCRPYLIEIPGGGDPRDPKGTQGDQMGPKGGRRPLGGWAHGALWGYSEAIPNGKLFRSQSEWKGRSEWMALPNGKLFHAFTQPRKRRTECLRICLVGFEQFS